jgi:hypothetical protein
MIVVVQFLSQECLKFKIWKFLALEDCYNVSACVGQLPLGNFHFVLGAQYESSIENN